MISVWDSLSKQSLIKVGTGYIPGPYAMNDIFGNMLILKSNSLLPDYCCEKFLNEDRTKERFGAGLCYCISVKFSEWSTN